MVLVEKNLTMAHDILIQLGIVKSRAPYQKSIYHNSTHPMIFQAITLDPKTMKNEGF